MAGVVAFHWDLGKRLYLFREESGSGTEVRLAVLINLMSHVNIRTRAWPSITTIMKETGYSSREAVVSALKWLAERGAIYNVPPDKRVAEEARLSHQKNVYQLTGVIELGGEAWQYILMSEEARASMREEFRGLGAEHALMLSELIDGLDTSTGSESEPDDDTGSESEPGTGSVNEPPTGSLTSTRSSTKEVLPEEVRYAAGASLPTSPSGQKPKRATRTLADLPPDKRPEREAPKAARKMTAQPLIEIAICQGLDMSTLSQKLRSRLLQDITVKAIAGGETKYQSAADHFDGIPGFREFVQWRIDTHVAIAKERGAKYNPKMLVGDICNFGRENTGWLAWQQVNVAPPAEAQQPAEVIIRDAYV